MLRVLGKATSINVRKVLWTCDEIGLPFERADAGVELDANPNGLVPVIVDGDFILWESNTIIRYLADSYGQWLLPREPRKRAPIEKWIDWQATEFNTAWRYAFMALVRRHPDYRDPHQIDASRKAWTTMVGILEAQLSHTGGFVAGPAFTLADIPIGLSVNRWFATPMERPSFPAVAAYYERLGLRQAFMKYGRNGTD